MPLTGPVPEGRSFVCSRCGALGCSDAWLAIGASLTGLNEKTPNRVITLVYGNRHSERTREPAISFAANLSKGTKEAAIGDIAELSELLQKPGQHELSW